MPEVLTQQQCLAAAEALITAERTRISTPQLSKPYPEMDIQDAYHVQDLWAQSRIDAGARIIGHKIGLTSRAMQLASNMTEPDSFTRPVDVAPGDVIHADYGPLGAIGVSFI